MQSSFYSPMVVSDSWLELFESGHLGVRLPTASSSADKIQEGESLLMMEDHGGSLSDGDIKDTPLRLPPMKTSSSRALRNQDWKIRAKIILPHVGLVVLSTFYTLLGGVMFYFIEHPNEVNQKEIGMQNIQSLKAKITHDLWNLSRVAEEHNWKNESFEQLDNFMEIVFDAYHEKFVTFKDLQTNETGAMWTFPAALFFSVTVITTIGYGHLVPHTFQGKMSCVIFALFGIPLILVTVADMGKFLSEYVVSVYDKYQDCLAWIWNKVFRCCVKTLKIPEILLKAPTVRKEEGDGSEENFLLYDRLEAKIPVVFVSVILVGYTAFGAVILRLYEPWTFFESFYYCFITVTTIGFGDIVPQQRSFLLLTLLYIITGLIITSMCIDLVGTQYIRKVHYFGQHMKKTRYALITMGDKVIHIGEVIRYMAFLQKRYGLTSDDLDRLGTVPEEFLLDCILKGRPIPPRFVALFSRPFIPREWFLLKWIDSRRTNSYTSERVLASLDSMEISSGTGTMKSFGPLYSEQIWGEQAVNNNYRSC